MWSSIASSHAMPARRGDTRPVSLFTRTLLAVTLLLCYTSAVHAMVFTTALTAKDLPAAYPGTLAVGGLYEACANTNNASASTSDRKSLAIRGKDMPSYVASVVGRGTYYIAGFYDAASDGWYWNDGTTSASTLFGTGATCTKVNDVVAIDWAPGYPMMGSGSTIGPLKYMVYSGAAGGWMNVDGATNFDGVACESSEKTTDPTKKFPWWGILIIVLAVVAVLVLVIVIICCCCCRKDKQRYTDADEDQSFSSRSSFSSRGTGSDSSDGSPTSSSWNNFSSTNKSSGVSSRTSGSSGDSESHADGASSTYGSRRSSYSARTS